ncbi:MAG: hypothetical protein ACJ786_18090 [Catenulispora sp.]|jgi:hypothetical protein
MVKHLAALPKSLRFFAEPFEVWTAGACLVPGVPAAIGSAHPQSLGVAVSGSAWLLHAWGGLLCLGAVATLVARWRIARPQTHLGDRSARSLEVVGLVTLATAIVVYAIAIVAVGIPGLAAGSITASMAGACGMRAWIAWRELGRERQGNV